MKLHDIAKYTLLKDGFLRASAVFGKTIILLFDIKKGVVLDNHNHPHTQFGYCFSGEFDFTVDGKTYKTMPRESYVIEKNIYHSAIATTDYYSMDFKYIAGGFLDYNVKFNILKEIYINENYSISEMIGEKNKIFKIMTYKENVNIPLMLDKEKEHCIMVSESSMISIEGSEYIVEPMHIYCYKGELSNSIVTLEKANVELFIVEIG